MIDDTFDDALLLVFGYNLSGCQREKDAKTFRWCADSFLSLLCRLRPIGRVDTVDPDSHGVLVRQTLMLRQDTW